VCVERRACSLRPRRRNFDSTADAVFFVGEDADVACQGWRQAGNVANIDCEPTAVAGGIDLAIVALIPNRGNRAGARCSQEHARALQLAALGKPLLKCDGAVLLSPASRADERNEMPLVRVGSGGSLSSLVFWDYTEKDAMGRAARTMPPSSLQRINGAPHATAERFEQIPRNSRTRCNTDRGDRRSSVIMQTFPRG
jgi:hypothetical protein